MDTALKITEGGRSHQASIVVVVALAVGMATSLLFKMLKIEKEMNT